MPVAVSPVPEWHAVGLLRKTTCGPCGNHVFGIPARIACLLLDRSRISDRSKRAQATGTPGPPKTRRFASTAGRSERTRAKRAAARAQSETQRKRDVDLAIYRENNPDNAFRKPRTAITEPANSEPINARVFCRGPVGGGAGGGVEVRGKTNTTNTHHTRCCPTTIDHSSHVLAGTSPCIPPRKSYWSDTPCPADVAAHLGPGFPSCRRCKTWTGGGGGGEGQHQQQAQQGQGQLRNKYK